MNQHSQLRQYGLFDARVPRYTSYPTAPNFGPSVGAATYLDWLSRIPVDSAVSVYVHVPFCKRLCWFCACRTQGTTSLTPVRAYLDTLLKEIALIRTHLPKGVRLSRLHWGGGTPTLLPADAINTLAQALFAAFPATQDAEFSVEIDPNEIDEARLDALIAAGMNRASIGVQDFDPDIQKTIGRLQSYELTKSVADMIRARGVRSLNADILYGLPHQTPERIRRSVEQLLTLNPDRVALYGYAHVPWMSRRQQMIPSDAMPRPEERLALFEVAQALFEQNGYLPIGIDHFARPGDGLARAAQSGALHRNFQGYTDDPAPVLLGLGASSISRFPQGYAQNHSGTGDYTRLIQCGQVATHRGHIYSGDDQLRARIIEALMCDFSVRKSELTRTFGISEPEIDHILSDNSAPFASVIHLDENALSIPPDARPLTRMIARAFDAYDQSKAQHSAAI